MPHAWTTTVARFALAAMLALVLVPTMGRLVQPLVSDASVSTSAHGHDCDDPQAPAATLTHGELGGGDCAYCPILASLSLPAAHALAVPALAWPALRRASGSLGRPGRIAETGLGARGPPLHG